MMLTIYCTCILLNIYTYHSYSKSVFSTRYVNNIYSLSLLKSLVVWIKYISGLRVDCMVCVQLMRWFKPWAIATSTRKQLH